MVDIGKGGLYFKINLKKLINGNPTNYFFRDNIFFDIFNNLKELQVELQVELTQ